MINNKKLNASEKVVVPNTIYDKLYSKNKGELRVALFLVQLLNSEAYTERTQNPKVTIKISKLNKLVSSNKPLPILDQLKANFSDELAINFDEKELTVSYPKENNPITYVFSRNIQIRKSDIDLYSAGEFTTLAFSNISKLRKVNSINLYLTLSKYQGAYKVINANVNGLFDDCKLEKKTTKSKENLLLEAIKDINNHIGVDDIKLLKTINNRVMITFSKVAFNRWQFNKQSKQTKGLTKAELIEQNKSLQEEIKRLQENQEDQEQSKNTQEKIYSKELDMKRDEIKALKEELGRLKAENKKLKETNNKKALITRNNPVSTLKDENKQMKKDIAEMKEDTDSKIVSLIDENKQMKKDIALMKQTMEKFLTNQMTKDYTANANDNNSTAFDNSNSNDTADFDDFNDFDDDDFSKVGSNDYKILH